MSEEVKLKSYSTYKELKMTNARHGDVLLKRIKELPEGAKELQRGKSVTIAEGEATGHHHTLYGSVPNAVILRGFDERRYVEIIEPVELRHQEHSTLSIEPGCYEIGIEREYDYFEESMRRVVD